MTFNPKLPSYVPATTAGSGNKLPAKTINDTTSRSRTSKLTLAADGATLPIVYGHVQTAALVFAVTTSGSNLVLGIAWCHGEIEEVSQILFDSAPPSGVTITNYTGAAGQGVDPTLAANITNYADTLDGIAYSVVSIPPTYEKIPKITGVIKGKKVYDPRTDTTAYSDNTVLCLNDFLTNTTYGCELATSNVEVASNFNDDIMLSGDKRCRIGLAFTRPQKAWSVAELLAEYAECFLVWEGDVVKIVPDKKESASYEYNEDNIVGGSLRMSVGDTGAISNSVEIRYTNQLTNDEPWGIVSENLKIPDVDLGNVSEILSSVSMDGIFRKEEAERKAYSRLYRPFISGNYQWTAFDTGIVTQVGDVVTLNVPSMGVDNILVRVTSTSLAEAGRYSFSAVRYSDSAYPIEEFTPPITTDVPVGAIAIKLEGDTPLGWEDYTAADGRYLRGSGNGVVGTGGSSTYSLSDTSSLSGSHTGTSMWTLEGGVVDVVSGDTNPTTGGSLEDVHSHTINSVITPSVKSKQVSLVRATTTHTNIPSNLAVLAGPVVTDQTYQQLTSISNYLLKGGGEMPTEGSYTSSVQIDTNTIPAHIHSATLEGKVSGDSTDIIKFGYKEGGSHKHITNVEITTNPIRTSVLMYTAQEDYPLREGVILPFAEGTAVPAGFSICDGTLGTPDLRGAYIEVTNSSLGKVRKGDSTISWSALTLPAGGHEHDADFLGTGVDMYQAIEVLHGNITGSHTHIFSGSDDWEPEYIVLDFYQFTGVGL